MDNLEELLTKIDDKYLNWLYEKVKKEKEKRDLIKKIL